MAQTWGSTDWGRIFTRSDRWLVSLTEGELQLTVETRSLQQSLGDFEGLTVRSGIIWAAISFDFGEQSAVNVSGIPNAQARALKDAVDQACADFRRRQQVKARVGEFNERLPVVEIWYKQIAHEVRQRLGMKRWITEECRERWMQAKPCVSLHLDDPAIAAHLARATEEANEAVRLWRTNLQGFAAKLNQRLSEQELKDCRDFFDRVEKTPLTEEQARAVLCFDNRVLVVASAGSGKTSTMVAKAGYALHRKLVPASKILLLAFNADAAVELQTRIQARLSPLGLPAEDIVARTFHAFGLDVIGKATGKRPTLAPWLDRGGDLRRLLELVDDLKDKSPTFRANWDLFRVVLGRDLPEFGKEEASPEDWDRDTKATGFRTLNGEVVKSQGERLLADWLFYHGVKYQYEAPYEVDTADAVHRQYRPEFYYPTIKCYHEHWALDAQGRPPKAFTDYLESMKWKRKLHVECNTDLIETTMADLWSGQAFTHLAKELTSRGITLDPNPDREVPTRRVVQNEQLAKTFRTFLTHAKSNRLSNQALRTRLHKGSAGLFQFRHQLFLTIFEAIRDAWEKALREEGFIDFEDMLNMATDHLEAGLWKSPFELIMVDEFQDASQARARLARALVQSPDRCLFAVGDDWQSINRFAGADMSVMTKFEDWYGKGPILRLERTFRCPQALCTISSRFVQKNPSQLQKRVVSETPEVGPVMRAIEVQDEDDISTALRAQFDALKAELVSGAIPVGKDGKISVYVLGRYRRDRDYLPNVAHFADRLTIEFHTIHSSKGLEADYVFLPRMTAGSYGFPSNIEDDPVMQLAMPAGDDYPYAEERRLFYVALTRARRGIFLITPQHRYSPFLTELVKEHNLEVVGMTGEPAISLPCPRRDCTGTLVPKRGRYGAFLACSTFPACKEKGRISAGHLGRPGQGR